MALIVSWFVVNFLWVYFYAKCKDWNWIPMFGKTMNQIEKKKSWLLLCCHLSQWDWPLKTGKGHHLMSVLFLWSEAHCCAFPTPEAWLCLLSSYNTNRMKDGENLSLSVPFFQSLKYRYAKGVFFSFKEETENWTLYLKLGPLCTLEALAQV